MKRRGRASAKPERPMLAVASYTPDQWSILKDTAADREKLNDTYEEWLEGVTQRCEELQAGGCEIRRVDVDMSELAQWCRSRGVPLDGKSRAEFAAYKARGFTA